MGVYVYTLRKNTIKAIDEDTGESIDVGVTAFAYKCSWNADGYYKRMTAKMHAAAERAREANPNLDIVTFGDPKDGLKTRIYRVKPTLTSFYDTETPGIDVGSIEKRGRKWYFVRDAA